MIITEVNQYYKDIHKALKDAYGSGITTDAVILEYNNGQQVVMKGCHTKGNDNTAILYDSQNNRITYKLTGNERILYVKDYNN